MRESRLSGSEGGALHRVPTPILRNVTENWSDEKKMKNALQKRRN